MTLEDRYGTKKKKRSNLIAGIVGASIMVMMGLAFLIFDGMPSADKELDFRDLQMEIVSDEEVNLTFEVTTSANRDMVCAIEALSTSYATVGSKFIEIPASTQRSRVFNESLSTIYRATTVTVKLCWFPETES